MKNLYGFRTIVASTVRADLVIYTVYHIEILSAYNRLTINASTRFIIFYTAVERKQAVDDILASRRQTTSNIRTYLLFTAFHNIFKTDLHIEHCIAVQALV